MHITNITDILLCRPTYFCVTYQINPWMKPGSTNRDVALEEWESLVTAYTALGIQCHVINQEATLPDMVFATDQGVVYDNTVIVSNFRYTERQGERIPYLKWYKTHHIQTKFLDTSYSFEGGDIVSWKDGMFLGHGFRTDKKVTMILAEKTGLNVYPLHLVDPSYFHLDTCLFVLNKDVAFFYPPAFDEPSRDLLTHMIPHLIPLSLSDVTVFCANSVVTDHHVIMPKRTKQFRDTVKDFGYQPVEIEMQEFLKAGGGIHCLTQILKGEE